MATLNFTGRVDIDRDRISIRLRDSDGKILLDVTELDLSGLNLPDSAEVAVEAYRQTTKVRVACGQVGALTKPQDIELEDFDVADNIQLRVRVVGGEGPDHGKILAVADHLRAVTGEDHDSEPLLKLQRVDLGDLVWKFGVDADRPILYINKNLRNHDGLINSEAFKALVLPEFFRQVALWIAQNLDDSQEPDSTLSHWLLYFNSIDVDLSELDNLESDDSSNTDIMDRWASEAASSFASQIGSLSLINDRTIEENQS